MGKHEPSTFYLNYSVLNGSPICTTTPLKNHFYIFTIENIFLYKSISYIETTLNSL